MLIGLRGKRLFAFIFASAFCLQMAVGAQALVLCRHSDGTRQIETPAQQADCHAPDAYAADGASSVTSSKDCTDEAVGDDIDMTTTAKADLVRVVLPPTLRPFLPWDLLFLSATKNPPLLSVEDALSPAAEQHALLLSAVVLLI